MMNKKEFLHLKSGTDVRGTAVETAEHGVQLRRCRRSAWVSISGTAVRSR